MDALPVATLQSPSTPAAAEPEDGKTALPGREFHALLSRQLADLIGGTPPCDASAQAAVGDEDDAATRELALDTGAEAGTAVSTVLSLLPPLQQAVVATAAGTAAGADPARPRPVEGATPRLELGAARAETGHSPIQSEFARDADAALRGPAHAAAPATTAPVDLPQAALHASHAQTLPAEPAAPATPPRIDTPLGMPGWSTELAHRLVWIANEQQQVAELHINPPHLGPVEIKLTISDDQTTIQFASPHAMVRDTIESTLPRLREVLADSGINLGQASVTADSPRDGSAYDQRGSGSQARAGRSDTHGATAAALGRALPGRGGAGLVDLFA